MSDDYMSRQKYIQHVSLFFAKKRKKAFKVLNRAAFAIDKFLHLFRNSAYPEITISFPNCQMVTYTIIGTWHHEANLAEVNSANTNSCKHKSQNCASDSEV